MKHLSFFSYVLGIIFFVCHVNAVPPGSRLASCSKSECPKSLKFRYSPGKSYSYRYEVNVASSVDGAVSESKESRIHLTAKVHFDVHTPCDWTLRVRDVSLQDSELADETRKSTVPGEKAFKEALELFDLSFTFHDGAVPNICPSVDEPVWSVNIKRGILSSFQNTMPRFDLNHESLDTDVSGTCKVDYVFDGADANAIRVLKTYDFSSCTNRYGLSDVLSSVPYRFFGAGFESIPLMNSTSWCEQTIASHRITQYRCEEKHLVRPFSNEGSGASTKVKQSMEFIDQFPIDEIENSDSVSNEIKPPKRSSLLFQHSRTSSSSGSDSAITLPLTLQSLCQHTEEGVESEAAAAFGRLVKSLRTMDYLALSELMTEAEAMCRDGEAARKHLLNGLISAATSDAIAAMRDEVIKGKVDEALIDRWITSLAFIPRPSGKHLNAALPLLDNAAFSRRISLSIASMVKKVCATGCVSEVFLLVGKLSKQLGNSCQTRSRDEREEIILALKSLSNIGVAISGDHLDTVKQCFQEKDNPTEVRITALKAFSDIPCHIRGNAAMEILAENSEDSEIRIAAYLGVMKCVDYKTFLTIKDLLNREEVNQVGSFIWTHLNNLATTSLPSKLEIQGLILEQNLVKKFDTDARKFSRNYEKSILLDQYNAAASLESNIVFSPNSYLPRSASLNLTVDIFGQSVNLLEFDGRMEGFELYIESLFGPGGIYHQKEVGYILEGLRTKRKVTPSSPNQPDAGKLKVMGEQFDAASRFTDEPEMSMSMKIFGNEVGYGHWEGRNEVLERFRKLNPTSKLHNLMNGEENQFSYASQYIDSTHTVPLGVGLPLNLVAQGQVVAEIRGNMRTDLKSIFSSGKGEVVWKVHPSAAVIFNGAMTVDAIAVKTGVTLETTLHSSVSTSGKFSLDGLRLFDLQIDFPQEKAEIITFKSDLTLSHRNVKTPLDGIVENRVEMSDCTGGLTQRYLGLQICSKVGCPNASELESLAYFPLTGPSHLSIELTKLDPAITSYRFLHKVENTEAIKSWTLSFHPEGAKESKEVGLKAGIEFKESDSGFLEFNLMLPSRNYETKGTFVWKEETKKIEASLMRDTKEKLLVVKAGLDRSACSKQSAVICYQPTLTLILSNKKLVNLDGNIKLTEKQGKRNYELGLNSTIGSWSTVSKGYYLMDEKSHVSNFTVDYTSNPRTRPERIQIEIKVNKESSQGFRQLDLHLGVEPSAYPNRNFVGNWRLQRGLGHFENVLMMNIGPMPRDNRNSLTIHQGFSYSVGLSQNLKLKSHFEMTLPAKGLNVGLIIGHEQNDYKTDSLFIGRYAPGKELQCGLLFVKTPGVLLKASGAFNLTLPSQPVIKLNGKIQEQSKNNYRVDADGIWGQDTDFQLSSVYDNQVQSTHSIQQLSVEVTGSTIYPTEFVYTYKTNHTALEAKVQSSYGKDAVSFYVLQENPTKEESKIATKIGYLNYLHTADAYWKDLPDGKKGTLDIHVDKVMDVRSVFSTDVATNGRRDVSLDVQWDPNRNPQKKLIIKTTFEPSNLNPRDWTSALILSYPGSSIKGNFAALTQKNNRSLSGTVDLGSRKTINFLAASVRTESALVNEIVLETPFDGWKSNKAVFKSETNNLRHKTKLTSKWGTSSHFEVGVDARIEKNSVSKSAEVTLDLKSSFDQLENFKIAAKGELMPRLLENSVKIQWGKNQEIVIGTNFEWSIDGQFMIKSNASLTTPFPQLKQVSIELHHNTEWDSAQLFETRGSLILNELKYTAVVKGENPGSNKRWEATAVLTTPNPTYAVIGLSSQYTADDKKPSFDLQINWPEKAVGIHMSADICSEGYHRGHFHVKTPFEQLRNFSVDGSFTPPSVDPYAFKLDLGTRWNEVEFVTFNTTFEAESAINGDISVDLKTSIPEHGNYGTRLKLNVDLSELPSASTVIVVIYPSNRIGFSLNGSMAEIEHGSSTDIMATLDIADSPKIMINITHETKGLMDFKTTTSLSKGEQFYSLNSLVTTTDDGQFVASLNVMTPMERLSESEIRIRYLKKIVDEANIELAFEASAKWKEFNRENTLSGRIHYLNSAELLEDFMEKTTTNFEFKVVSPLEILQRLTLKAKLVNENSEMMPKLEAVYNNHTLTVGGSINFISENANIVITRKTPYQPKATSIRMNSTWALEDDKILVKGVVSTNLQGFNRIPWKIDITIVDSEDDENVWERLVTGEARLTNSQLILLNAAWLPAKLTANIATPFTTFKNVNLTVGYEQSVDSSTSITAELFINENLSELTGTFDWPQENTIPVSTQLTLKTPYDYEQMSLSWESADPRVAAELSASWNEKSQTNNLQVRYNLDVSSLEKIDIDLKLTLHAEPQEDTWAFRFNSDTSEKFTGLMSLTTPLADFKSAEISASNTGKSYTVLVNLNTKPVSGKLQASLVEDDQSGISVETSFEVLQFFQFAFKFAIDGNYSDVSLDSSAVWDPILVQWGIQSKFKRSGWSKYSWNTTLSSDSDRKWLLDVDVDFKDISSFYNHRIHYEAVHDKTLYSTYGSLSIDDVHYKGQLGVDWGASNPIELKFNNKKIAKHLGNSVIELITPWSKEPSLVVDVTVDARKQPVEFKVNAEVADRIVIVGMDIKFNSFSSMGAKTNIITTKPWLPMASLNFHTDSGRDPINPRFNGSYVLEWSGGYMLGISVFREETDTVSLKLPVKNVNGLVQVKSSWNKVPEASIRYSRLSSPTVTQSGITISHNFTEKIKVAYNSTDKSSAGHESKDGRLEFSGTLFSGGFAFGRHYKYSGGQDGENLPRSLHRILEIYEIGNRNQFTLRAEVLEKETFTGQEHVVKLSSPYRTIDFSTRYDFPDGVFRHGTEFRWRPDAKIAYDIEIENKTTAAANDYVMTTTLITPVRSLGLTGTMRQTKRNLRAVSEIVWDLKRRESVAKVTVTWENTTNTQNTKTRDVEANRVKVAFSQGNLPQELAILTEVHRSPKHPLTMHTEIQYSNEPKRNLLIDTVVTSRSGNYRCDMNMTHQATKLKLRQTLEYERNATGRIQLSHFFSHSNTDSELMALEHLFTFDQQDKKIIFSASSPVMTLRHLGQLTQSGNNSLLAYEIQQDDGMPRTAEFSFDSHIPYAHFVAQFDPENRKGLHMKAGMPDRRQAILELFNTEEQERIPFFDFAFRLNHSRLVTSKTQWPTDWKSRLYQGVDRVRGSLASTADQWVSAFVLSSFSETVGSILTIGDDIAIVLDTALLNFSEEIGKLQEDAELMKQNIIDGYNSNAFFAKLIVEMGGAIIQDMPFGSYAQSFVTFIEKTGNRILKPFTNEDDSFSRWLAHVEQYFSALSEAVTTWMGEQWKWPTEGSSKVLTEISAVFRKIAEEYDRFVKHFQKSFWESMPEIAVPLRTLLKNSWNDVYEVMRPLILRGFVTVEAAAWNVMKEVLDYFYKHREAIVGSTYFQKLSLLLDDLKQFYLDMQSTDWPSRVRKYVIRAGQFLQQKYLDLDDYLSWIVKIKSEIAVIYQGFLMENPELQKGAENWQKFVAFIQWSYSHLGINQKMYDLVALLRERGTELWRQTVTDAQMRHTLQKTMFRFNPELGSIELEQKLPFPWISLDETPLFHELPEIQKVRSLLSLFKPSNTSTMDLVFSYLPRQQQLSSLLPPFKSSAHLVGLQHFTTFDGQHFDFVGPCTYLLARDFLTNNFTLAVQYISSRGKPYASVLQLIVDDVQWDLDLANRTVRANGISQMLPTFGSSTKHGTAAFYENGKFVIESFSKGIRLECIAAYDSCTFTVSGWYSNKVAGLLGTMDNEPTTDLIRPNRVVDLDLTSLASSWDVSTKKDCKTVDNFARKSLPSDDGLTEICASFFQSQRSTLKKCLSVIDPSPYLKMCLIKTRSKGNAQDGCHAAAAYASACAAKGVLLRIPSQCVRCQLDNELLSEGDVKNINVDKLNRPSSDVVLLLDLKKCNEPDATSARFLPSLINTLEKELITQKVTKNRYSLVVFGGKAPYDIPRVRTVNGQEFVAAKDTANLFENLPFGNGPAGIMDALRLASKLNFRPGVSKTFILLPCSSCESDRAHEITSQSLFEQDVTIHVLTNAEFRFIKANVSRQFLGLDATMGFTSKEVKGRLIGDADLRRQARLSHSLLGMCAPVALETNGTIFAVSRLREQRKNSGDSKRAVNIWVKRVAMTIRPADCQKCTCNLKNYFESVLDCRVCKNRETLNVDTSFLVDEATLQNLSRSTTRNRSNEK